MKKLTYLALTLMVMASCNAQKADLALNLEKGKEYTHKSGSEVTIIQDVNGQKINTTMSLHGTMSFLVKSINGNEYLMDVKYTQLSMTMKMPQVTMEFSSEKNDETDIFSKILSGMMNKPFEVTMNKNGKILAVKNVADLWETAIAKFDIPEVRKEQVKAQITKSYGEEAFKGNIEMVTAIFPDNTVNKGDKWSVDTKLESGMSAMMKTEYEFAEQAADYLLIKGNSIIETEDKEAYVESNGMPMKYDMKGTMTSDIKVDKKSGWILSATIHQEIKGDAHIKDNPQIPGGMTIPMTMINNMTISNQ